MPDDRDESGRPLTPAERELQQHGPELDLFQRRTLERQAVAERHYQRINAVLDEIEDPRQRADAQAYLAGGPLHPQQTVRDELRDDAELLGVTWDPNAIGEEKRRQMRALDHALSADDLGVPWDPTAREGSRKWRRQHEALTEARQQAAAEQRAEHAADRPASAEHATAPGTDRETRGQGQRSEQSPSRTAPERAGPMAEKAGRDAQMARRLGVAWDERATGRDARDQQRALKEAMKERGLDKGRGGQGR